MNLNNYRKIFPQNQEVRVGVLSDTHGYFPNSLENFFKNCHIVFHAGDVGNLSVVEKLNNICSLVAVFGNIDGPDIRSRFPEIQRIHIAGLNIFMMHICGYPGKYKPFARKLLEEERPDVVITGHSHILKIIYDKTLMHWHINPGACGQAGWHHCFTAVRFEIRNKKIENLELWEMERKII